MTHRTDIPKAPRLVPKGWGHEWIWADTPQYCGKVLHFEKAGNRMSLHLHVVKHETWWVMRGSFEVEGRDPFSGNHTTRILKTGDVMTIPQCTPHRLIALADHSEIVEVSTCDHSDDNIRQEPGDGQAPRSDLCPEIEADGFITVHASEWPGGPIPARSAVGMNPELEIERAMTNKPAPPDTTEATERAADLAALAEARARNEPTDNIDDLLEMAKRYSDLPGV